MGVNEIATRLTVSAASELSASGPGALRALAAARAFAAIDGTDCRVAIRVHQAIPEHVGLGSGTQLALAVGMGLARFHGIAASVREIARDIERGARSGIGIATFEQGGLIVDGGRGANTSTPPIIVRMAMPAEWRFILAFDRRGQGLHGKQEVAAFEALPPFPVQETARLCHLLLLRGLPALAEGDIQGFGSVVTELQNSVGDHFAPAQGGRFTSPEVGAAMNWLAERGAVGIGQTSWGPTGFCLLETPRRAAELFEAARARWSELDFMIASPRNCGAEILPEPGPPAIQALRSGCAD